MTSGETKFALNVEAVLNKIPDPEYRQLLVEALMVLTIVSENQANVRLGPGFVNIEQIVREANQIFLKDCVKFVIFFNFPCIYFLFEIYGKFFRKSYTVMPSFVAPKSLQNTALL